MPSAAELKSRIEQALPGAVAEVEGADGVHFEATVSAPQFAGLPLIKQHKLVMDVFAGELGGEIHALAIKTKTIL